MGKYVVYGTRYLDYSIEVEAGSKDEARDVALGMSLDDWDFNNRSGVDVYEITEGGYGE
jgi:hypothetical protein